MNIAILSLIISGIMVAISVWNFFEARAAKKESKLNIYSKAEDVKRDLESIIKNLEHQIKTVDDKIDSNRRLEIALSNKVVDMVTDIRVLEEKVDNEIKMTEKLLDKLSEKLDELQ